MKMARDFTWMLLWSKRTKSKRKIRKNQNLLAVRPPPRRLDLPFQKTYLRVNLQLPIDRSPESLHCSETSGIAGLPPGQPLPQRNRPESLMIKRNQIFRLSRARTRATRKTTKLSPIQGIFGGKVTSQRGTRSSYVTLKKIPKKSFSKLRQENHNKELRKSPQRRMGKATHNLEEPRRIIYTYHEGSYKV
jgi:hypothetical protein